MSDFLKRYAAQFTAALVVLLVGGWFASYTAQQRAIGALSADLRSADTVIARERKAGAADKALAVSALRAVDSIEQVLTDSRARAKQSDAVASQLTKGWADMRDQVLHAQPGHAVPSLPVVVATADSTIKACTVAREDCKARADTEQQRGDSARVAAIENGNRATHAETALSASQSNEKRLKAALPSTAGKVTRAAWWSMVGAGVALTVQSILRTIKR